MKSYPFYQALNLVQTAEEILAQWKKNDTFRQSIHQRKSSPAFIFYEGPPSANGAPGIHHVLTRTLKDLICRYKTMQGYKVDRKSGWDTHGLPVELQVEKELGIRKDDIGKEVSIEDYNKRCEKAVMRYQKQWEELTEKIGYWIDLDTPYKTCSKDYILSLWSILKRLYEQKVLYKGYSIQPYSPAAGTGLSTHELNQPGCYKMVKDTSVVAQFQLKHTTNTYLLAWTTTPWTLPANSALAINKNATYVKVHTYNPYTCLPINIILAEECLLNHLDPSMQDAPMVAPNTPKVPMPWQIVEGYQGTDMIGWQYEQLLPYIQPSKPAFRIFHADFATLDGTGIIHIAPTFGKDDYYLAQEHDIPAITVQNEQGESMPIVDSAGRFIAEITDFAGAYVKDAYAPEAMREQPGYLPIDVRIIRKLKEENKLFRTEKYEHSYPHCWRTDKPVIFYPLSSWFIKTTAYKERLIQLNKTINWYPGSTGRGRFGEWLENVVDWNVSRSRFWGTPLPIWRTKDGEEEVCIGSLQQLSKEIDKAIAAGVMQGPMDYNIDLHRPYVDNIVLVSTKGEKMYRELDLVDVWFDAGAMPYAQNNHPLPNNQALPPNFPADFIAEGIDQTRGWFFTLHVLAVILFDHTAFNNVLSTGFVLDKYGNKMSKRLGNTINPFCLIQTHGPDTIRWYLIVHAHPWDNLRFDISGLKEVRNRFFGTLYNTYQFFALYARLDGFKADNTYPDQHRCQEIDLWILSRLQRLIQAVTEQYNAYNPTKAARAIQDFVIDDLSNWYVRLNRKRFWQNSMDADKHTAYQTLYTCLQTIAQLSAPIAPFYMDKLYQDLEPHKSYTSVHLSTFPQAQRNYCNTQLEEQMQCIKTVTSLVHSLRKKHNIKVKQPLAKLFIFTTNPAHQAHIQASEPLIRSEVNIKTIVYTKDMSHMVKLHIKPNFQELKSNYGTQLRQITKVLAQLRQSEIKQFKQKGYHTIYINQAPLQLTTQQVIMTTTNIPGFAVTTSENITVALDLNITEALQAEGYARVLINRLQNLRKEYGLAVEQKIYVYLVRTTPELQNAINTHKTYIMQETQALQLVWKQSLQKGKPIILEGKKLFATLVPANV